MTLPKLLLEAIHYTDEGVTLADPSLPDMPLVYVNDAFCRMTGYSREEVLGKNCRFLQGPETDETIPSLIIEALSHQQSGVFEILNYRKDGSTFWNRLSLSPLSVEDGRTFYVGVQSDISQEKAAFNMLTQHHNNLLKAIGSVSEDVRAILKEAQENNTPITGAEQHDSTLRQVSHQLSLILTMIENDSADILDFVKTR